MIVEVNRSQRFAYSSRGLLNGERFVFVDPDQSAYFLHQIVLYEMHGYNASAVDLFLQLHEDENDPPSSTSTPLVVIPVPARMPFAWQPAAPGFSAIEWPQYFGWWASTTGDLYSGAGLEESAVWLNASGWVELQLQGAV